MIEHISEAFAELGHNIGLGKITLPEEGKISITISDQLVMSFEVLQDEVMVVLQLTVLEFDSYDVLVNMHRLLNPMNDNCPGGYFYQVAAQDKEHLLCATRITNEDVTVSALVDRFDTLLEVGQKLIA